MPAIGVIKLLDANVWLALAYQNHVHHFKAAAWMSQQSEESCAFCRVTQMALLRHLTNTKIMGPSVQTQKDAWKTYDICIGDARTTFLDEPAGLEVSFRQLSGAESPSHYRWTDSYLAALAKSSGAILVSFDTGLTRHTQFQLEILSV